MVALAYIAACATAGAFAAAAITQSETAGLPTTAGETFRFLVLAGGTTVTALGQAFYPALVAVALSEGLKLRGIVLHLVAGVLTGKSGRDITAHLPGGDLQLRWDEPTNHVFMTGPAATVFTGEWLS